VLWVANEEDALDGVERGAGQLGKGVGGGGGSLGVPLQDETLVRVARQGRLDLPNDVGGTVDGVVDLSSGELALNVRVHGTESSRRALDLACAAGVDNGVARAGILPLNDTGLGSCRSGKGKEEVLELHFES
jgi:hypothetical protein